jgi:hypothetical protein
MLFSDISMLDQQEFFDDAIIRTPADIEKSQNAITAKLATRH